MRSERTGWARSVVQLGLLGAPQLKQEREAKPQEQGTDPPRSHGAGGGGEDGRATPGSPRHRARAPASSGIGADRPEPLGQAGAPGAASQEPCTPSMAAERCWLPRGSRQAGTSFRAAPRPKELRRLLHGLSQGRRDWRLETACTGVRSGSSGRGSPSPWPAADWPVRTALPDHRRIDGNAPLLMSFHRVNRHTLTPPGHEIKSSAGQGGR